MYSTCLFCHANLGRNEVIETFPVGRRLAFDAARGRLWVVCTACRNWNLSPLEQRWEAVEACERIFRDTVVRVSTDNIGLATIAHGLDLVRVGKPLRPEFAAWRYGSRLRRRRVHGAGAMARSMLLNGSAMAVGAVAGMVSVGATITGSHRVRDTLLASLERAEASLHFDRILAHVRTPDGALRALRFSHVARLEIVAASGDATWSFRVAHTDGTTDFAGAQAVQMAGNLLARLNRHGGTQAQIRDASQRIADAGDADRYIRASSALRTTRRRKNSIFWDDEVGVLGLTAVERMALEIAVHEDAERLAMQGELSALEDAWRDAEEIAAIADALFDVPAAAETAPARIPARAIVVKNPSPARDRSA